MKTLAGTFLLIFGAVWVGGAALMIVLMSGGQVFSWLDNMLPATPGLILLLVGGVLFITGKISDRKLDRLIAAKAQQAQDILQRGVSTRARVTFVDKNYRLLLNQQPIYAVIEYVYEDQFGRQHTGRKADVDAEQVIRQQIAVGGEVEVKYLPADPAQHVLVM